MDQKDSVKSISPIPSKFFDEVTELLKPVHENLDQIFKKMNPDLYESYQKDIEKLSQINDDAERSSFAHSMKEKYYPFLKEGWAAAQIDEKTYKEKITGLLPDELRKLIRFDADFLNFYFDMLRPPQSNTWLPRMRDINQWDIDDHDDPTPPNTPPPPPCSWVEGTVYYPNIVNANRYIEKILCADADAYGVSANGVFARANTWPFWGRGLSNIDLISYNGPADNGCSKVKVRKTIYWEAALYAFTFYGHLTVSTAEYNSKFTAGNITAVAPLLWYHERKGKQTIIETYTIYKNDGRTRFGANLKATVSSEGIFSHGSSKASLSIPSWTLTELCCK